MSETHARYSPSKLEKKAECPHFEWTESDDNEAADEGTLMHKAVSESNLGLLETAEQKEQVQKCIALRDSICNGYIRGAKSYSELLVELHDLTYGTLDFLIVSHDQKKATLLDWKMGRYPVTPAKDNIQGKTYAGGVFEMFPKLEEIEVGIVCPRQDSGTWHTYHRAELPDIRLHVIAIKGRAANPESEPTPNEEACLRCGKKGSCSKLHEVAIRAGEGLLLPTVFDPMQLQAGNVESATKAMVLSHILEDWAVQVRKRVAEMAIEEGVVIPGFSVRTKAGSVSLSDPYPVIEIISKDYNLTQAEVVAAAGKISFSKLVSLIHAVSDEKKDKQTVKDELLGKLSEYAHQSERVVYMQREKGLTNEAIIALVRTNG
jgi:hypothetical protein